MTDAPLEGTVTVLFTDVEASTELHMDRGDEAAAAMLAARDHLIREQVELHKGVAIKSLGDGLMAAFSSARRAVACAVGMQRAIGDYDRDHPDEQLRIRIGLNTGEVSQNDGDLQGAAVSAAARVAAKAQGGQILVPSVVKELAGVMPGVSFANRGRFRLKGFPDRWQLFEVLWHAKSEAPIPAALLSERAAFVSRERERATLREVLDRAIAGQGALVMIGGEPGVGKTRLCQELALEAEAKDYRVLVGHCYESEASVPYMPFVEILEAASQVVPPDLLMQALGDSAPEVARILPRLRRLFPEIPPPLELPPEQERRYLFNSLREFISRGAAIRPQLVILEDLHWADESTLLLLQHVAEQLRTMRTVVLGTYRDVELDVSRPLARTMETLIRGGLAQRMSLRRFDETAVSAMLHSLAGRDAPPALVRAVFEETEGNPFFVQEVFKYLVEKGELLDADGEFKPGLKIGELDVPESLRLVIGRRLERLSENSRKVLAAAAVLGRDFSYQLLDSLSEVDADALLDAVDEAERAHIIVATSEGRDATFSFAHEVIRQTLLSELSTPRRQRLHLRAADALERVLGQDADERAAEIAQHLFEAGAFADTKRIVAALRRAAARAIGAAAFEDALRLLELATPLASRDDTLAAAALNEDLGRALRGVGRWNEAMGKWEDALGTYEQAEDHVSLARLASEMATQLNWAGRNLEAVVVAGRGLAGPETSNSADRATLLGQASIAFSFAGNYEIGETQGAEAFHLGQSIGDESLAAKASTWYALHKFFWVELQEASRIGEHAAGALRTGGMWWQLCDLLAAGLIWCRFFLGDLNGLEAAGDECLAVARRVGHTSAEATAARVPMLRAWRSGKVAEVPALVASHLQVIEAEGYLWGFDTYAISAIAEFRCGRWENALEQARIGEIKEIPCAFAGEPTSFVALVNSYLGDRRAVVDIWSQRQLDLPRPGVPGTIGMWTLAANLIEALFVVGAYDQAAELTGAATELLQRGAVFNWVGASPVNTSAGLAFASSGDWDAAEEHLRRGVRDADAQAHHILSADARRLYGSALIARGPSGRADHARSLLTDARTRYLAMGMERHALITETLLS
jgi:class 3 adenylate cyclase/tetratricopeptide (TPR) repeat protein